MRGFVNQYDRSALRIYAALKNNELNWLGVADRRAGIADDLVLGLHEKIVGHQFKTSRFSETFTVTTLLLGKSALLGDLATSWRMLRDQFQSTSVEIRFITDDVPSTTDKLATSGATAAHSASFIAEFARYAGTRSFREWSRSRWGDVVRRLKTASGLSDSEFSEFFASLKIICGNDPERISPTTIPNAERPLVDSIASLLPRFVADDRDQDRMSRADLLQAVRWPDPIGLRHEHDFPIGEFVQRNEVTEAALLRSLDVARHGYISLLGPPGSGKSTLLQTVIRDGPHQVVARYLAYRPGESQGIGRAEARDFLIDVAAQLRRSGLGGTRPHGVEALQLQAELEALLAEAGRRFASDQVRTAIVVDGLDHVPREEKPDRSFISDLPLPQAIPLGVFFILGSQSLDLSGLPGSVRDQAALGDRCVSVAPLNHKAIAKLADEAGVPDDVSVDSLYKVAKGHPLVTRYLIAALKAASDYQARKRILEKEFKFSGDIELVYDSAWRKIADSENARKVLRYVACAETPIDPHLISLTIPLAAIEQAFNSIQHLLAVDRSQRWSVFHNSFRLHILGKKELRLGRPDENLLKKIYSDLADLCPRANPSDPQRWMELRYRARAGDHDRVALLANPQRFREELRSGRSIKEIQTDIRLSFAAARLGVDVIRTVSLLLSRHELTQRFDALTISDVLARAYLEIGDVDRALNLLDEAEHIDASFSAVDALVARGRTGEARVLFDKLELMLARSEERRFGATVRRQDLFAWASRVHRFRDADQISAAIDDMTLGSNLTQFSPNEIKAARGMLRYRVCHAVASTPDGPKLPKLLRDLKVSKKYLPDLLVASASAARRAGNLDLAKSLLTDFMKGKEPVFRSTLSKGAILFWRLGRERESRRLFKLLSPPTLEDGRTAIDDDVIESLAASIYDYGLLAGALGERKPEARFKEASLATLQNYLTTLGMIAGEHQAGKAPTHDVPTVIRSMLRFLRQRPSNSDEYSQEYRLRMAHGVLARGLVDAASQLGATVFSSIIEDIDKAVVESGSALTSWLSFRRELAVRVYRRDNKLPDAIRRLEAIGTVSLQADTPSELVSEIAELSIAFVRIGCSDKAREVLDSIHAHTLGYALPAKKDPQYSWWEDVFSRACDADPASSRERVLFLSKLLLGLAETEGRGAASRIASAVIERATFVGAKLAYLLTERFREASLVEWTDSASELLLGACRQKRELVPVAAEAWGALVVPYLGRPRWGGSEGERVIRDFIEMSPQPELMTVTSALQNSIEVDADIWIRHGLLEALRQSLEKRALPNASLIDAVNRWRSETPPKERDTDSDKPSNIEEVEKKLSKEAPDSLLAYSASEAIRIAPYAESQKLVANYPRLLDSLKVRIAIVERAIEENRMDDARRVLGECRLEDDDEATWDSWTGGAKRKYYELRLKLEGPSVRKEAFESFTTDLEQGKGFSASLLVNVAALVELIAENPDWKSLWAIVVDYLSQFREYRLGQFAMHDNDDMPPRTDIDLVAWVYKDAFSLQVYDLNRNARSGLLRSLRLPEGLELFDVVATQSLAGERYLVEHAVALLSAAWSDKRVREAYTQQAQELIDQPDIAISCVARQMWSRLGHDVKNKSTPLPAFYSLHFDEDGTEDGFRPPASLDPDTHAPTFDDALGWTWIFRDIVMMLANASGVSPMHIRMRAHQIISEMGGIAAFGRDGQKALIRRLERLSLRLTYCPPRTSGTLRALRRIAYELWRADRLSAVDLDIVLYKVGYPAYGILPVFPTIRPPQIAWRGPGSGGFGSEFGPGYLGDVIGDVAPPSFSGEHILAEYSTFRGSFTAQQLVQDRVILRKDPSIHADSSETLIRALPTVLETIDGRLIATSRSPALVSNLRWAEMTEGPIFLPVVCPYIARELKWSCRADNRLVMVNRSGQYMARTIWWRDGGEKDGWDDSLSGIGSVLLISTSGAEELRRAAGPFEMSSQAWRTMSYRDEEQNRSAEIRSYEF